MVPTRAVHRARRLACRRGMSPGGIAVSAVLVAALVAALVAGGAGCSDGGADAGARRTTTTEAADPAATQGPGPDGGGADGPGGTDGQIPTPTLAPDDPAAPRLAAGTLGALRIGMTTAQAEATGLLEGGFVPGCELADPRPTGAVLRAPLVGAVTATDGVVTAITVSSGTTTAEGVRPGMTLAAVRAALEAAGTGYVVDDSQEEALGILVVRTGGPGRPLELAVDPADGSVTTMATPALQFCE